MRAPPPSRRPVIVRNYQNYSLTPLWIIIGVNLLVLVATFISGRAYLTSNGVVVDEVYRLNYYMGLIPAELWERPWTMITNLFAHAGFGHLIGNMLVLFFFGRFLTMLVGHKRFLWIYFGGGIVGNILFLLLGEPYSIAVGASGAVYAIAGVLVVLMPNLRVYLYFLLPMPLWVVVLVFFVLWSFIPGLNIAWQAHIGGLLVGLTAGYILRRGGRYYYFR
jgi:membrane associated rhomboid family serine protease